MELLVRDDISRNKELIETPFQDEVGLSKRG